MLKYWYISISWPKFIPRFLNFPNILGEVRPCFWSVPSLPGNAELKKVTKHESAVLTIFVLTLGFLWIQSSKPNLAEEEKERKEAMQTDRNKIPERWKNFFKSLETKVYKSPQLSPWHQIFSSMLKIHSVKKYKESNEMQRTVWMYFKTLWLMFGRLLSLILYKTKKP